MISNQPPPYPPQYLDRRLEIEGNDRRIAGLLLLASFPLFWLPFLAWLISLVLLVLFRWPAVPVPLTWYVVGSTLAHCWHRVAYPVTKRHAIHEAAVKNNLPTL